MVRKRQLAWSLACVALALSLWPASAQAQRGHFRRGPIGRPIVVGGGFYGYPFYGPFFSPFYDPFFGGPWLMPFFVPPFGFVPQAFVQPSALRLQVTPRQTEVYIDGSRAGTADDFDGFFQRLQLPPGQHEVVLYLEGYETVRQSLYLAPGSTYKIRHTMKALSAGETSSPRPTPPPPPTPPPSGSTRPPAMQPPDTPEVVLSPARPSTASGFGTLSIRVQPANAEMLIDGERWQGPEGREYLVVQVSEGLHRVEIRKDGYQTFSTEVQVRRGETATLNVSLPRVPGH